MLKCRFCDNFVAPNFIYMNKLFNTILICIALMVVVSCDQSSDANSENQIDSVEVEELIPDSANVIETKEPLRVATNYKFATPNEAIEFMKNSGEWDKYSESIIPQMTFDCLSYAQKLLNSPYNRFIVVDKHRMRVILFDRYGREEKSYRMACAKNYGSKHQKADSRTPEGFFSAQGVYDSTDWLFRDDDGTLSRKRGQFGPRFIRLRTPVTSQIGIHGTCAPWSIGGRCSHGCIRITNEQILELVEYVEVGMPIIVSPGLKDTKVNMAEGYDIPWISTNGKPIYKYVHVDTTTTVDTLVEVAVDTISFAVDTIGAKEEKNTTEVVDTIKK